MNSNNKNDSEESADMRPKWMSLDTWYWIPGIAILPYILFGIFFGVFLEDTENIDANNLMLFFIFIAIFYCVGAGYSIKAKNSSAYSFVGYSSQQWLLIPPLAMIIGAFLGYFLTGS